MISEFKNEYRWLSNFYPSVIEWDGIIYPTVEHAYQGLKTNNIEDRKHIASLDTPGKAKKAGKIKFIGFSFHDDYKTFEKII